jgi:NhaA family Na+:H+ antiporter
VLPCTARNDARETLSPVERLEFALHPWVGFVFGKPVGILAFSWVAVRLGIAIRPPDLDWRLMAGGGMLAGIGFTMALLIANLAFDQELLDSAKLDSSLPQ